jgi:cell division septation protein DedD
VPALFAPATPSAPAVKSPAPAAPAAKPPAPMQVAAVAPTAPADKAPAPAAAATSRFALELGPFKAPADAERVEQQLMQAGYATVRPRKLPAGPNVYAVLLERIPGATEAQALVSTLREQGYGEAVVTQPDPPVVRLGEPVLLRRAVELAERLRAAGYQVRVAAQPGEAAGYTIRHGAFPSRPEAEARAEELGRLGLSPQVVQVR